MLQRQCFHPSTTMGPIPFWGRPATIGAAADERRPRDSGDAGTRNVAADPSLEPQDLGSGYRSARLLERFFAEVLLVGGASSHSHTLPGRAVAEVAGPSCPLRGLVSALEAATAERVLIVAADLPVVPPELVLALTAWPERDAVVPRRLSDIQPLCAIYRRPTVLEVARARLDAGRLTLVGLLDAVDTGYLEDPDLAAVDPLGAAFLDANVAVDRQRAREILSSLS